MALCLNKRRKPHAVISEMPRLAKKAPGELAIAGEEFCAQLHVPVLGDFLGFREAFFFRADAPVLAAR